MLLKRGEGEAVGQVGQDFVRESCRKFTLVFVCVYICMALLLQPKHKNFVIA